MGNAALDKVGQKLNFLVVGDLCFLPRPHDKAQLLKENSCDPGNPTQTNP